MSKYAKIRAALEIMRDMGWSGAALDGLDALADLERAAAEPVMWQYLDTQHVQIDTPPPSDVWRALYAAPPVPAGMFTAEEMAESWICGNRDNCNLEESDTYKLIQDRTK